MDLRDLAEFAHKAYCKAFKSQEKTIGVTVVDSPDVPNTLVVESAIVAFAPTKSGVYIAGQIGDFFVPCLGMGTDAISAGTIAAEKVLDSLAEPLRTLGVAVSPRVRSGMARYIASSAALIGSKQSAESAALDEQIAQRVLSKIRSITSVAQKKALDAIADVVDSFRDDAYSPSRSAIERLRSKEHFFGYESES